MSKRQEKITRQLTNIGACWAVTSSKCVLPDDGYDARPTYHVHPDRSHPHQIDIMRFDTLFQIEQWLGGTPYSEIGM